MCRPEPVFRIGDKVAAVEFTDCFGITHPRRDGLTITNVTLHEAPEPERSFYHYKASTANGFGYVIGAARFFELLVPPVMDPAGEFRLSRHCSGVL